MLAPWGRGGYASSSRWSGSLLCGCSGREGDGEAATGCQDLPVLAFDHETIDSDGRIGHGVYDWHPDGTSLLVGSETNEPAFLVDSHTGAAELLGTGIAHPTWSADGDQVYAHIGEPADSPERWRIVAGHLDDGGFVEDRTVLAPDDLAGTPHEGISLHPGFALDVGPCG